MTRRSKKRNLQRSLSLEYGKVSVNPLKERWFIVLIFCRILRETVGEIKKINMKKDGTWNRSCLDREKKTTHINKRKVNCKKIDDVL